MGRSVAIVLAVLLVATLPVAVVSGISTGTSDYQNELEREETIQSYERYGSTSADFGSVEVTIAKDSADVGYDYFISDSMNDFLKINHTVDSKEEVVFYVPDDYFQPRPNSMLPPLERGGPSATLDRVSIDGEYYTKVSVTFDGEQTVIYPIDRIAGGVFSVRYEMRDTVFNTTPVPEPSNEEIWRERSIDKSEIRNGTTIVDATVGDKNRTQITVVYEPDRPVPFGTKLPVPECGTAADTDNVCIEEERGGEAQILFKNVDTENPTIQYKHELGFMQRTKLTINDMAQIRDRIEIPFYGGGGE